MDMILDRGAEPSFEDISGYIAGEAGVRWNKLTG